MVTRRPRWLSNAHSMAGHSTRVGWSLPLYVEFRPTCPPRDRPVGSLPLSSRTARIRTANHAHPLLAKELNAF